MKTMNLCFLFALCISCSLSQNSKEISISIAKASTLDIVMSLDMDVNDINSGKTISLYEVKAEERTAIPVQVDGDQLIWIINGPVEAGTVQYEIVYGESKNEELLVEAVKDNGHLTVTADSKNLLRYQFETMYPPEGVDTAYKRSAYIHPLWTPNGQVLTRIQPPDHYHHYGIWNPWTRVYYEGDTIDFWNLKDRLGTVRFAGFQTLVSGPVYSEYEALHEHVVLKDGADKVAMNELQKVRVYSPHKDYYIFDLTINLQCATESPFKILEYRYAGLGWRATEEWNEENSEVLTSTGKTRKDADGSLEQWYLIQGELGDDYGGALVMSHNNNYCHPEPVRIWPLNYNERGDVFGSFTTTKNSDWLLEPGETYTLQYRFVVYNGKISSEKADNAWHYYTTYPELIKIQ